MRRCNHTIRRGFTLVEVIVAGVITAFVIAAVSSTVGQLARAKSSSRQRLTAFLRADAALNAMRVDVASIIRDTDLFQTRLIIEDDLAVSPWGDVDRDEILLFNTRLRAVRDLTYQGEGLEYETHYRVEDDPLGSVLWQRRDSVPDEFTLGGGQAIPFIENIVGVSIEAYDGVEWREQWDSDEDGLPLAVRLEITASGQGDSEDDLSRVAIATLRTVVAIDRVVPPKDWLLPTPEEELELEEYLDELLAPLAAPAPDAGEGGMMQGEMIDRELFEGGGAMVNSADLTPEQRARIREAGGLPDGGGAGGNGDGQGSGGGGSGGGRPPVAGRNPSQPGSNNNNSGGGGTGSLGGGGPDE